MFRRFMLLLFCTNAASLRSDVAFTTASNNIFRCNRIQRCCSPTTDWSTKPVALHDNVLANR